MIQRILDNFLNHLWLNIVLITSFINTFRDVTEVMRCTNIIICWIILGIIILSDKIDAIKKLKEQE